MPSPQPDFSLPPEIIAHYQRGMESGRLLQGVGQLEFLRTQEILRRHLPHPPATLYDVGGGSGLYACWLAQLGYEVHLVDIAPLHIEQARAGKLPCASPIIPLRAALSAMRDIWPPKMTAWTRRSCWGRSII